MTDSLKKPSHYPKAHVLAMGSVAALLIAVLALPSRTPETTPLALPVASEAQSHENTQVAPPVPAETSASTATPATSPATPAPVVAPASAAVAPETAPAPEAAKAAADDSEEAADGDDSGDDEAVAETKPTGPRELTITTQIGDTLSDVLDEAGLDDAVLALLLASKGAKPLERIQPGQTFELKINAAGELERLQTRTDDLLEIEVSRNGSAFAVQQERIKPTTRQAYARGVVDGTLAASVKRAGLPKSMAVELSNIFAYDVDFALSLRKGDEFEVVYEENVVDGRRVSTGKVLAARFTNQGKTYTAMRYTPAKGNVSYYNADGKNLRKAFIRTPIDVVRISSRFTNSRRHPVLNVTRAHKGVDYAARVGTPIRAAGDGKIVTAERQGGYGNVIIIQHNAKNTTLYGHMKGFAKGIREGMSVKQGQVIGYVGTTGLSSGPHLHYEFRVAGVHVDPLKQKQLMAEPLAGAERQRFIQDTRPLVARMDRERSTLLAMNQRQQQRH